MKGLGKSIIVTWLLIVITSSLSASKTVQTSLFSFEIPNTMELRIEDLSQIRMVFSSSGKQTYTLQPKGTGTKAPSASIILTSEPKQRILTNNEFRQQSLASSAQSIEQASRTLEMDARRKDSVSFWEPLSFTEVSGLFAWKYSYIRNKAVRVETYILHLGEKLLSIEMIYPIAEQSRWKAVFDRFLTSQIVFKIQQEAEKPIQTLPTSLMPASIPFSEKTFLWHELPQWKRGITIIPNRRGYYIYTLATEEPILQSHGYHFKVSQAVGLDSQTRSTSARNAYLLQAQMDILKTLDESQNLEDLQIEEQARDEKLQAVLVRYSYRPQELDERIHGALAVKITQDRFPLHIEAEWRETGAGSVEQILSSLLFE